MGAKGMFDSVLSHADCLIPPSGRE